MIEMWLKEHGRERASKHALRILDEIEAKFALLDDPRPLVTSIRIGVGDQDEHDFEVEVELTPGAMLVVKFGSMFDDDWAPAPLDHQVGAVAQLLIRSVAECDALGLSALADLLHDLRVRTRKTLADWSAQGTHVKLVDARLVGTEYWPEGPTVEVRLGCLNDRLRPAIQGLEVPHPRLFEHRLAEWRSTMEARFAAQTALARQGADGMVDQIVLNALAQQGDVASALRKIAAGGLDWSPQGLTVVVENGHIRGYHIDDPNFGWDRSSVRMYGVTRPASVLDALVGQSVRSLVEHPVLSDDMIILHASSTSEHGVDYVSADFEQPRRLFCSASGRVWEAER